MNLSINESIGAPTLDKIIDRNPVIVKADNLVINAIALMARVKGKSIPLANKNNCCCSKINDDRGKSSYVLVVKGTEIVGIFTERDLVKLIAEEIDLTNKKISEVMSPNVITLKQYQNRDVSVALRIMREHNIRHLPVVGSWGQLIGIITHENIRSAITPACLLKMRRVGTVMSTEVVKSSAEVSLKDTAKIMSDRRVSCVVIVEKRKIPQSDRIITIPIGIVTERDLVEFQVLELNFATTRVGSVMSQPLFPVHPQDSLWQTHQLMRARKVRRLVVVGESGELAGIVTQSSILQVFDPLEMSRVITVLQQQVEKRTAQLEQINQDLDRTKQKLERQNRVRKDRLDRVENFEAIAGNIAQEFNNTLTLSPITS